MSIQALYMLPVLHEPTFMKEVADVYEGSRDPFKNFKLKMVLAISLQKYHSKYAVAADGYFLSGLQHLEQILEPMDHSTLQCLLVMVQYALVKPTRIAVSVARPEKQGYPADARIGVSYRRSLCPAMYPAGLPPGEDDYAE